MVLNTKPPYHFKEGALLLINKPLEWTSFNVVKKVKYTTKEKTGHAGTLDPLATGLLLIGVGKYTKKLEQLQGLDKTYTGIIKLGATTPSFDRETEEENQVENLIVSEEEVLNMAKTMTGEQEQVPPMFSALKKDGKKLYELARKGKTVERKARKIKISQFDITKIELPFVHFEISCTKGTYIRTIANDFGANLGCGGYLHALCRTRIGDYHLADAWEIDDFVDHVKSQRNADS